MKIGFIGLGIMGRPMVKNLLQAGAEVIVSDLNQEAVKDVVAAGGKEGSYAEIGEQCDKIIIMVQMERLQKRFCSEKTVLHQQFSREALCVI
mgnify:CR=1 FL=1